MKILYSGWFLKEGFRAAGCEVTTFQLSQESTLNELIDQSSCSPDFVFIELFGKSKIPNEIHKCSRFVVLYCIDAPINEFWLRPLSHCVDMVFVDQLSTLRSFLCHGIEAYWLPLCSNESDFRQSKPKKHLITFVGRISNYRLKRRNILDYISKSFPVNVVEGVSRSEMLDVFSESHVVLNENFFSGINLRFFQALASGSLLLSEKNSQGLRQHFKDKKHYLGYSPSNLNHLLNEIEKDPSKYTDISERGQKICWNNHRSLHRAELVLDHFRNNLTSIKNNRSDLFFYEACAKYHHGIRFGGDISKPLEVFKQIPNSKKNLFSIANYYLGSAYIMAGKRDDGHRRLELSSGFNSNFGTASLLKLLHLNSNSKALLHYLQQLLPKIKNLQADRYMSDINQLLDLQDTQYHACVLASKVLFDIGEVFDPGYLKQEGMNLPDYALEYACLAYQIKKCPESLGLIIDCSKKAGIIAESLSFIKDAILCGAASDEQISLSTKIAKEYYDFEYISTVNTAQTLSTG